MHHAGTTWFVFFYTHPLIFSWLLCCPNVAAGGTEDSKSKMIPPVLEYLLIKEFLLTQGIVYLLLRSKHGILLKCREVLLMHMAYVLTTGV